jgi:hypothetical protein
MKIFFTISFLQFFLLSASAQLCNNLYTGKFIVKDVETGITIITRNKKYQIEENKSLKQKTVYSITWTSECTYELRPVKVIEGPSLEDIKDIIVTVEIKSVRKHGYKAICTSNFDTEVKTFIVEF